jgi:hypothetical protein
MVTGVGVGWGVDVGAGVRVGIEARAVAMLSWASCRMSSSERAQPDNTASAPSSNAAMRPFLMLCPWDWAALPFPPFPVLAKPGLKTPVYVFWFGLSKVELIAQAPRVFLERRAW